jgi:hypothetical protein
VIGRRVDRFTLPKVIEPGDYGYLEGYGWYARTPNGHMANLNGHTITDHGDSITVEPSIKVSSSRMDPAKMTMVAFEVYHGFLERGVWRPA